MNTPHPIPADRPIGWGILGAGSISGQLAWALSHVADARLAAVGSRSQAGADAFAAAHRERHPQVRAHGSYADLVADPAVDIVYIGTPHPDHVHSMHLALAAGKAVLCEKPLTVNRAEAGAAVALARAQGVFLMEAMWTRCLPAVQEARRRLAGGEIGEVLGVTADFGFRADHGSEHRVFNPALAGGALLDIGIYPLSLAAHLLGPVVEAQAMAQLGPTGVDVQLQFLLRHAGGRLSQGQCTLLADSPCEAVVLGSTGRLVLESPFHAAQSFRIERRDAPAERVALPWRGNGFVPQVEHVHACLRAGLAESPLMPLDESLALMGWMDHMRAQVGVRYPGE